MDMINTVLRPENYGLDKLHLFEEPNKLNDYSGNNILAAGYIGANPAFWELSISTREYVMSTIKWN